MQGMVKDFSKITKDPHRFGEEFAIVIQFYQPGFSNLCQLLHLLVSEHQAQHGMTTANWENSESSLELQLKEQPSNLLYDQAQKIA